MDDDLSELLAAMARLPVEEAGALSIEAGAAALLNDADFEEDDDAPASVSRPTRSKGIKRAPPKKVVKEEVKGEVKEDKEVKVPAFKEWGDDVITTESLIEMANDIFGEERVDLQGTIGLSKTAKLIIYFPEFTISNSQGKEHIIRGLYVRFDISLRGPCQANISMYGVRSILTTAEYNALYAHSHLQQQSACGIYTAFCQGSSRFRAITTNLGANASQEQFMLMLMSVQSFLEWESIEGRPYMHLSNLGGSTNRRGFDFQAALFEMSPYLPTAIFDYQDEKGLSVNLDHPALAEFYEEHSPIKSLTAENGSSAIAQQSWNSSYRMNVTFKGAPVAMTIISTGGEEHTHVNPDVIRGFNVKLTDHITRFNEQLSNEYLHHTGKQYLGEIPSFQQAKINRYRELAEANLASSQRGRRQGVVGGVDNLRKREDNRLR